MQLYLRKVAPIVLFLMFGGCTHLQLQKNYNRQAKSLSQIYEQQVLDNLAMFSTNAYATPFFAVPGTGTNTVNDQMNLTGNSGVFAGRFWKLLSFSTQRQMNEQWPLQPVVDPVRLKLMQCSYQKAIGARSSDCIDCCKLEKVWFGSNYICSDECDIKCGWVRTSQCWRDVPKCCCDSYGKYCSTYAWVDPCFRDEFSKLVMRIIDFGSGKEPQKEQKAPSAKKEVRFYLNKDGGPAGINDHYSAIIATVDADKSWTDLQKILILEAQKTETQQLLDKVSSHVMDKSGKLPPFLETTLEANSLDGTKESILELKKQLENKIGRMDSEIHELTSRTNSAPTGMQTEGSSDIRIGPPAQSYGDGLLQLQQRLNAIGPR